MSQDGTQERIGLTVGGRFRLQHLLYEDWLGDVYAARDDHGDPLAVKVLHPDLSEDLDALGRFGREMLAMASISHANTLQMIDFGEDNGLHWVAHELAEGPTVQDLLDQQGRFSAEEVVLIGTQVSSALAAAHAEGFVHRNVCAQNVVLVSSDRIKLKDFGLGRLRDNAQSLEDKITSMERRVGSPTVMAPEYIRKNRVAPSIDLYGLGVLLWQMLVGHPPFQSDDGNELMRMHLQESAPSPSQVVSGVPQWLDRLVEQLMAKRPERRPSSAEEVSNLLLEHRAMATGQVRLDRDRDPGGGPSLSMMALVGLTLFLVMAAAASWVLL